jgi:hypothetical protein
MAIGTIQVELIFSHPAGKASGSGIVPPEVFTVLEAERTRYGIVTKWWHDSDPTTGQQRPAFTPIAGRRLALIEGQGIRHGDRFVATFEVKEVTYKGRKLRQMWLVDAQPIRRTGLAQQATDSERPSLRERLAALEHQQWAHWTRYSLDHLTPENVELWRRKIDTPYENLCESDKDSDQEWADRVLELVKASAAPE